ncbi:L-ascorbate metabolism protein UlaG (beta-lactamase superfamily) [Lacibacter cauensis]|uniref:L-ascorbate metabolism protein UlaG (Beta-lactamase superfamily) n=1 Tax=Lacibacter cauensis TaxID=510947 RepID=A0A562SWY1_9BACT|nr:MBL fold metallo-hydrolase [Lacibacter cauensis]TWI85752.1 L-ascorbate metabolism protein UlaG (beta-lactamase superfamily) [Lacibacter cauensis]
MTNKLFHSYFQITILFLLTVPAAIAQRSKPDTIKTVNENIVIQPVFHASMRLQFGKVNILIDPYNSISTFKQMEPPALILITDIHQDHMDTVLLNTLNFEKVKFIVPQAVAEKLPAKYKNDIVVLQNNEQIKEHGISITAVPMYDLPQTPDTRHPKGRGNSYLLEYGGKRIYISGDTDDIPEMRALKNIDIAFVCMNQPFTMTVQQAASAVLAFKPKIIYPYHYRNMNGFSDTEEFKKIVSQSNSHLDVRIRNWYEKPNMAANIKKNENVVYGMVSGASLTMDIYKPEHSNKIGIITIPGTAYGYAYRPDYEQASTTQNFAQDSLYFGKYARQLVEKGYTIFVINHRLAPDFRYTDIVGDCQRAVRFIRFNAHKFDIDPDNIGAFGYSSGATLCSMLGVKEQDNDSKQTGPETVSSKVQCVVTLAARFDLSDFNKKEDTAIQNPIISRVLFNYVGELPMVDNTGYTLSGKYAEASPLTYVNKGDASFLIYSSYDDPLVPHRQETAMYNKLVSNGVDAKLKLSTKGGHFPVPDLEEIDKWLMQHLKKNY